VERAKVLLRALRRFRSIRKPWIFVCASFCTPAAAYSQNVRTVGVDVENDYFDFWRAPERRSDDNYTQGFHVSSSLGNLPGWAARNVHPCGSPFTFPRNSPSETCAEGKLSIGQELYTPTNDAPQPILGERPYAALLFVDLTREAVSARVLSGLTVRLGVTGPPALGKETQEWFHRQVSGFREPLGWDHQIRSQAIFFLRYDYRRAAIDRRGRLRLVLAPKGELILGNLATSASAGIDGTLGYNSPHPWDSDIEPRPFFRIYLTSGAQAEWIGYSLILRGNTPETSGLVQMRHLVPQWYAGVYVGLSRLTLGFKSISRGLEYQTGPSRHTWGQIALTYEFF